MDPAEPLPLAQISVPPELQAIFRELVEEGVLPSQE